MRFPFLPLLLPLLIPTVHSFVIPTPHHQQLSLSLAKIDDNVQELTPQKVKQLRKQAKQLQARQQIPILYYHNNLDEMKEILLTEPFIMVKGISKDDIKQVRNEALQIEHYCQGTFLLDTSGHTAIFVQPNNTQTYTTGKINAWRKREPKPRDERGQIIIKKD